MTSSLPDARRSFRDIGAGQTIDQLKLMAMRPLFCRIGTQEENDEGLLHFVLSPCRAYASALGDPRPWS